MYFICWKGIENITIFLALSLNFMMQSLFVEMSTLGVRSIVLIRPAVETGSFSLGLGYYVNLSSNFLYYRLIVFFVIPDHFDFKPVA